MNFLPSRSLLRWPRLRQKSVIPREFSALISYLREAGCTFHSCHELGTHPVPRGISFRYDVHVRDLPGAFEFAALHREYEIPATFFVFWDYSAKERAFLGNFLKLKECAKAPLEIGLHDSPVDAYLIQQRFANQRRSYSAWLDSVEASEWLKELSRTPEELQNLNEAAARAFEARVEKTKELFGRIRTVAAHGGELGQKSRDRLAAFGSGADVALSFIARNWLTPDRVAAAGLDAAVDSYGRFVQGWKEFGCVGGAIDRLAEKIRRYLSIRNSAIQLLLHPYTWTGDRRDTELSRALYAHGSPKPMDTVSNPFRRDLLARWPEPPLIAEPVTQLCTATQFREAAYTEVCETLGERPRWHRKQWEFAYLLRCLQQAGKLGPGRHGLGFLKDSERLPAVFASLGCDVVALTSFNGSETEQRERLFVPLLERAAFDRQVSLRSAADWREAAAMGAFDFCWSSASASHAGSLQAGLKFVEDSLSCLRPGGVAVHTVEFNLESDVETVAKGPVVLYRERDLMEFVARLRAQGHSVILNLHPGAEEDDLRIEPQNPEFHLKLYIQDVLATSAGICIVKAS